MKNKLKSIDGKRITLETGKRKWYGLPETKVVYRKGMPSHDSIAEGLGDAPTFFPSDYDSPNPAEARRMAYDDAENHASFFRELADRGVYPLGTRVKVKRIRHSDGYGIEVTMPEIKVSTKPGGKKLDWSEANRLRDIMEDAAAKRGYKGSFDDDVRQGHNYGQDRDGNTRYIDLEILEHKLPYAGRKSEEELRRNSRSRESQFRESKRLMGSAHPLEKRVLPIITIITLAGSVIFSSLGMTSNVIGSSQTTSFIGAGLFILGLILSYWHSRIK